MQGTRHEKAAIVATSYIIGFITAFILYNNVQNTAVDTISYSSVPNRAAAVASVEPTKEEIVDEVKAETVNGATYKDGLLEMTLSDGVHLLSFNPEVSDIDVDVSEMKQGFHFGNINYRVSESGTQVFFCEQHDIKEDSCLGFVYDSNSDKIYQIIKDGVPVTISLKSASEAIWTAVGLKIGSHFSESTEKPWVLTTNN